MIITSITQIGDPQILLYEGKYYCYATHTNHYSTGFSVWVSEDMDNWSEPVPCFEDAIASWGKSHFWAPEVVYQNGKYYATNDYAICVSVADTPFGPWKKSVNNPVLSCRADLFGAGHNAFFEGKDGELYTSFHVQTDAANPSGDRRVVIGRVTFSEKDGEIFEAIE